MFLETENAKQRRGRNVAESREVSFESKERAAEEQEKKMAARERAEKVSREVKTTRQQIQNIVANMQQVIRAVQAIRAQLGLAGAAGNIPSVERDKTVLEGLRRRLMDLNSQLADLRLALAQEEERAVREEAKFATDKEIRDEAARRTGEILRRLGLE